MPYTRLNAAALTDQDALILPLLSDAVPTFRTLVDSGSEDQFMDIQFAEQHRLPQKTLQQPLRLRLFDGSSRGIISKYVTIPVRFPCGTKMIIDFLLTTLDPTCSAVLGHRWLRRYNPRIDWFNGRIHFTTQISPSVTHDFAPGFSASTPNSPISSPTTSSRLPLPEPAMDETTLRAAAARIDCKIIGAAAFDLTRRMRGSMVSAIYIRDPSAPARSASANPASETGEGIPEVYHEFLDVFSKEASNRLPEHRPYDLKIDMEDGASLPSGPIYSLSEPEQLALREYIQDNLSKGHIRSSSSPGGLSVISVPVSCRLRQSQDSSIASLFAI